MSFESIRGHGQELKILKSAIKSDRVAHGYLFAGPRGVGKNLTARVLAKALNCEEKAEGTIDACGVCDSCKAMDVGSHINFLQVEPEKGVINVEKIRGLQKALKYRVEKGTRVAIIEDAHRMNAAAASAFLKTLEEPTEGTVLILISPVPADLFPTIISRCQRINFRPLSSEDVATLLVEKLALTMEDALELGRVSGGSLSKAMEEESGEFQEKRKSLISRLSAINYRDKVTVMALAEELSKGDDIHGTLEIFKSWLRDLAVTAEGAPELVVNSAGATVKVRGSANDLLKGFAMTEEALRSITPPRYGNKQLTMEVLLMGLSGVVSRV